MSKTTTRNADGSATVTTSAGTNPDGSVALTQWDIRADQIDAHRAGDPSIDAGASAPTRAQLDADKAARIAAKKAAQ